MRVLNFGSCNIDYVYSVPHFVGAGETIGSLRMERFVGGKGLNQSIAIARSGQAVYHAGCIGPDGGFLRDVLIASGTDVTYLQTVEAPTGHAIIQVEESGENCIIIHGGANREITAAYVDEVLGHFAAGDILVLQNEINNLEYLIDAAYAKGMQIVLNPSPFEEALTRLDLHKITYLLLNEVEAAAFAGKEQEPEEVCFHFREHYPNLHVVLTLGKRGCMYIDSTLQQPLACPAFSVVAKDTTSAGDTFTGYFISGITSGLSMPEVLRRATAASALAVSKMGASSSIPTAAEVQAALPTLKPRMLEKSTVEKQKAAAMGYIREHLTDACLEGLAKRLQYSHSHTAVWVKEHLGCSFTELVQQERCHHAAQLLKEGELPIEQVIKSVGYENGSFFRKVFAKFYHMAPLEYRKSCQRKGG